MHSWEQIQQAIEFIEGLGTKAGVDPLNCLWRDFHDQKVPKLKLDSDSEEIGVAYPCLEVGYFNYFAGARTDSAVYLQHMAS